jgi:hypothetical protein
MTPQLWIGFGFLLLLVLFLIWSIVGLPTLTDDQRTRLKFLSALCAGFSGGFLTGSALFEMHKTVGTTTFAISGAAGCALFFTVWFFYPRVFRLKDGSNISIPAGWTLRDGAQRLAQTAAGASDYEGFTTGELNAPLKSQKLAFKSVSEGIVLLRLITVTPDAVRPYDVVQQGSVYRLVIRAGG